MERRYLLRLAGVLAVAIALLLWLFALVQVHHLEKLVIESNQRTKSLETSVNRLRASLADGSLRTQGTSSATHQHFSEPYYRPQEWAELKRAGNMLELPSSPVRVPNGVSGGTLQRAFIADIPSLNPLTTNAADVSELYSYISESLSGRDRDAPENFIPSLAYRIESNDDFTEFHVWLKSGVYWHTLPFDTDSGPFQWIKGPHEVTADDFVFAMQLTMDPHVDAAHLRNYFEKFDGIEVLNDHEFIVRWKASEYTNRTATLGLSPLPRWLYGVDQHGEAYDDEELGKRFNDHWFNQYAIGTGPFRFVQWEKGGRIRVERNHDYHDEPPFLEAIEFRVIQDATARLNSLRAGDLDYIPVEPPEYKNEIQDGGTPGFKDGSLHHKVYEGPMYRYIGWNADSDYFSDRRVRLAMTHAFNRELTIEKNIHGLGEILSGPFPLSNPAYDHSIEPWSFDLERANELLEEAGWKDRDGDGIREKTIEGRIVPFRFRMLTYGHRPEMIAAMEIYKSDLRKIGVHMDIVPAEWSVLIQRMQDKAFDAYTGGWLLSWETDLYQLWHSSQADLPNSSNRIGFRNEQADMLIERVRKTFDEDERNALFQQFHALVHQEQPYTFWFQGKNVGAWQDRVKNVEFSFLRPFDSAMRWYLEEPLP